MVFASIVGLLQLVVVVVKVVVVVICMLDETDDWLTGVLLFRCRAWKAQILIVIRCASKHSSNVYRSLGV